MQRDESIGTITLTKFLDSTTTKLHQLCLECVNYDPDQYIDGRVEVHICRSVEGTDDKINQAGSQIYMAYMLENCLLTSIKFDASDSTSLTEELTISFETILVYMIHEGKWETKGWDFVDGEEISAGGDVPEP